VVSGQVGFSPRGAVVPDQQSVAAAMPPVWQSRPPSTGKPLALRAQRPRLPEAAEVFQGVQGT